MELIQSKSILELNLIATENLLVEQRKVSTASFDVKNRVLTFQYWIKIFLAICMTFYRT
jgi:hypothetical protein